MRPNYLFILLAFYFSIASTTNAQEKSAPLLFISDGSGSMWGQIDGKTKIAIAAEVLGNSISKLPEDQQIGLMAYGHRREKDCSDVEMMVDITNKSKQVLLDNIKRIKPLGRTPLAHSAQLAIDKLSKDQIQATIILVTDGIESCDGNICDVVKNAKAKGISFKLHIVGFGLKNEDTAQLKCAAEEGGGQYFDAQDAGQLTGVLDEAINKPVDEPAPNFSLIAFKNDKPVDAWVRAFKLDSKSEIAFGRTYQDTAEMYIPPGKYEILIEPLEGTDLSRKTMQIEKVEGQPLHKTISFDGAKIEVTTTINNEPCDAIVKLFDISTGKRAAQTRTYSRTQSMEVDPGTYKVSFEALKLKGLANEKLIENVELIGGQTKSLTHNFDGGILSFGVKTNEGELIDASINIVDQSSGKPVASGRTYTSPSNNPKKFNINPGTYTVKIATLGKHKGNKGTYEIQISTGKTTEKIVTF